ncbi:hypothetical protein NEMIN01_0456 [Nematocida minor]|uniref:uncharacterized protein n=1 Tax=Nematocida minor TaxID=1912983 RepID=UPI00221ED36F|nr:uncharacterized protein NEMIN01_0456 [Nematocida minor]KAI5189393.1 hypothetical protein NEMIN01_0456 [Nematocida minor]
MKFKLVEDGRPPADSSTEGSGEETSSEEDFFQTETKHEYSSEEDENMWEDSNEDKAANNNWSVEKIEKKTSKVKKAASLAKNLLKYDLQQILVLKSIIEKVQRNNGTTYLLDRTGNIYSYTDEKLCRIEMEKNEKRKYFKDFIVIRDSVIIALTKAFHSFVIVDINNNIIKEVNLYQYKDKIFSRIRKTRDGFILVGHKTLYIYNNNCILIDRIIAQEKVLDVSEDGHSFIIILTESRIVKYCKKMKEMVSKSEVLVSPQTLCTFDGYVGVGGKRGLSLFKSSNFDFIKDINNLEDVTAMDYMSEMGLLSFGDKTRPNGMRIYNVKDEKIITTFPPSKGLDYIGGFTSENRSIYFGVNKKLYALTVPSDV